jgi:uncharacterized caspase-like protein
LVIGNAKYEQAPLDNPANDARAISKVLKESGFSVTEVIDQNRDEMKAAVLAFSALLQASKQPGLFYFAGHAVQIEWRNYLLPINQNFDSADDVVSNALDITDLTKGFKTAKNGTNIIILDACRDNPFAARNQVPKGLTQMDAPSNTFLAYATAPGQVALDAGSGSNGLYTEHVLREVAKEGVKIEDAFKRVRLNVRLASKGKQIPWETTSLENDFYFKRPLQSRTLSESDIEAAFEAQLAEWKLVRTAISVQKVEDYLRKYPSGAYSELAHHRLERLLAAAEQRDRDITQLQKLMMATANSATLAPPIPAATPAVAAAVAALPVPALPVLAPALPVLAPTTPVPAPAVQAAAPPKPAVVAAVPVQPATVTAPVPAPAPAPVPAVVAAAKPVAPSPAPAVVALASTAPLVAPVFAQVPAPAAPKPLEAVQGAMNPAANPVVIAASSAPQIDGFAPIRASGIMPGWRVGDALTYRTTERFGAAVVTSAVREAAQVLDDKIITVLGNEYDLFGNPLKIQSRFEVLTPPQWFIHEYTIGKRWSTRYKRRSFTGAGDSVVTADMRVVAREQITLPAGQFDAFKVKIVSYNTAPGYNLRTDAVMWVDAASSKMLASETQSRDNNNRLTMDSRVDLVAYKNAQR